MSEETFHELSQKAAQYAKAEAERVYLSEFRKSKKALLMQAAQELKPGLAVAAQEREAYAHEEYIKLLESLQYATELSLKHKMEMKVMEMRFETWRTKNANKRAEINMR